MFRLLDCIADINRFVGMYVLKIWCHIKSNCIYYSACAVIFQLQFDMFKIFTYQFARAEIKNISCTEYRILISGTTNSGVMSANSIVASISIIGDN